MSCHDDDLPEIEVRQNRRGTLFGGLTVRIGAELDWTGAAVAVDWRKLPSRDGELGQRWDSEGEEPLITLAVEDDGRLVATVVPHVPTLGHGLWYGDLKVYWPEQLDPLGGVIAHTFAVMTWAISDDRTV